MKWSTLPKVSPGSMWRITLRIAAVLVAMLAGADLWAVEWTGRVVDADTGQALAARIYVQRKSDGEWLFVRSADPKGEALPYREQWVPMPQSVERHTTISAHPFRADLAPGRYEVTIERGKEYFPQKREIRIEKRPEPETFALKRWINMAERGWYSGETHVHRRIQELPNVQLAEDLNVAFPVTFWTVRSDRAPDLSPSTLRRQGPSPFGPRKDVGPEMQTIDKTHVFFPRNTEYEIFSVGDKRHVLGAVFLLNHRSVFTRTAPPVRPIAEQAHREGALLDLDKHSWPWSMMLVPIAKVDLFELSNNSVWRTNFGFRRSGTPLPAFMQIQRDQDGMTEWGWVEFGLQSYYMLLNCGFRLTPTAGTASGVHPVPLGHSRVYVHLDGPFSGASWIDGLREGRSFVTTGPMLFAKLNGKHAGAVFRQQAGERAEYSLKVETLGQRTAADLEVIINGRIARLVDPQTARTTKGANASNIEIKIPVKESSWIAVRYREQDGDGRYRFAHTAPWHIEVGGLPVRPRREEVAYLLTRMQREISRNRDVLDEASLKEFEAAMRIYQEIAKRAK